MLFDIVNKILYIIIAFSKCSRSRMVRVKNYSGRQCFSLSGGASKKLSRLKMLTLSKR